MHYKFYSVHFEWGWWSPYRGKFGLGEEKAYSSYVSTTYIWYEQTYSISMELRFYVREGEGTIRKRNV